MVRFMRVAVPVLAICLLANSSVFAQGPGGGRGRGGFGMGGMGGGMLLMSAQVQKELKLTDEQTAKIGEIQQAAFQGGRGGAGGGGGFQNMTDEERQKFFEDMRKRAEESQKKMAEVLTADQNARLKQIQLWVGGYAGLLANAEALKELKITDDQKEALKLITDESGKKMGEIFQGGRGASPEEQAKNQEKLAALRKETDTECQAVLTDEQKAQFAKMRGDKFELDFSQMGRGGPGRRGGRPNN